MPANQSLYPVDWRLIATCIKEAADWVCQECGKQCRRPGEPGSQADTLTVHHIATTRVTARLTTWWLCVHRATCGPMHNIMPAMPGARGPGRRVKCGC